MASCSAGERVLVMSDFARFGGHLQGCTDRITGKEIFYSNPVIRGIDNKRGPFLATGIETNFPLSHGRDVGSPVSYAWQITDGVARVIIEDTDLTSGMEWRAEFILRPGVAVLEQRGMVYNPSVTRKGYQWWVNAAVELDDRHLRILYPTRWMMPHGEGEMTSWPVSANGSDLSDIASYRSLAGVGLFAHLSSEPWMAIYKPSQRSGLAHYADVSRVRGKKIWIWGTEDQYAKDNLTENFNSYVEMQAGELESQPEFGFLLPGQSKTFEHYWIPFHNMGGVSRATPEAILNVSRAGNTATVELQGARVIKGATLRLADGGTTIWQGRIDLSPRAKFMQSMEAAKVTVDLLSPNGKVLLHHVEGEYNAAPFDKNAKNPEPTAPGGNSDSESDALATGEYNEQRDQRVFAWNDYGRALKLVPTSSKLLVAEGRMAMGLNRFDDAISLLKDVAPTNAEAAFYYGVALASSSGQLEQARTALTAAAKDATYTNAARLQLALLTAREKGPAGLADATKTVQELAAQHGTPARIGALEVALLRRTGSREAAKNRLAYWFNQDPADEMLRFEQTLSGDNEGAAALWNHLAADPERVLNLAEQYRQMGDYEDALKLLERHYPEQPATQKEPGKVLPQDDPLVAYFRGYCKLKTGQDAQADFALGRTLSSLYIFPHQAIYYQILNAALAQDNRDAVAHNLLGDLYFDSYLTTQAMAEWKQALALKKDLPALHRNLGLALLNVANDPNAALPILLEGSQDGAERFGILGRLTKDS